MTPVTMVEPTAVDRQLEERFLVLAPTGRDGPLTHALLEKAGLTCFICESLDALCHTFDESGAAALMIAEEILSGAGLTRVRDLLSKQSAWSDVPVLIFTGTPATGRTRSTSAQQLTAIGNVTLLDRPLRPETMLSAARTSLRARRRQYDARAELLAQQRAVRERDQFLAMLGHELRNPLSALSMALNLDNHGRRTSKYREIMLRQVGNLTRLVDDLLDVSRVTSGKIALQREPLELVALTRRCVSALAHGVTDDITLRHITSSETPVWTHADVVRIEQVVNNLINNAIKYTTGGRIEVRVASDGDQAVIEVSDTGIGLAPEMIDRIFDLFTQVEASLDRAKGGMGIGLTLVRGLVGLHGGSVEARSAGLGLGSVFTVRLPRVVNASNDIEAVEALATREESRDFALPLQAPLQASLHCEVLIIEDNEDSRDLLAAILRQRGYDVFTAEDGPSGVDEALARHPDVLLVDIGLPGLDGYGVARQVRERFGNDVYMVALTGYGQPSDRARAAAAGFDMHLTKPVDINALEQVLAKGTAPVRPRLEQQTA